MGNSLKKQVSIILTVDNSIYLDEVLTILKNKNTFVNFFIDGTWLEDNSNYLLKWELIKKLNQEEFKYFNLNGIVGEFKEKNKYSGLNEMKLGYNASAIEYIGEFDLIINKTIYNIYQKRKKNK